MGIAFTSIRSKLIGILAVLGVLPLLSVGYLSYKSATEALQTQAQGQLGNLVEKTAQQVDDFIDGTRKGIDLVAGFPFIQLAFLQYEFGQRLDTVQKWLAAYRGENPYLNRIYLIDLQGRPILTVPERSGLPPQNFRSAAWFRASLEQSPFLEETGPDDLGIRLAKRVVDFEDAGKAVGVIAFEVPKTAFTDFLTSLRIGEKGYAFLLHHDGYLIHHPVLETLTGPGTYLRAGDERLSGHIERMMKGQTGHGNYRIGPEEQFLVYTACRRKPWSIGISVSQSEMMAGIDRLRRRLLTICLVVAAMILPVSLLFIKSITRPIRQLISGVKAVGKGDLDQTIRVESTDELQAVAEEFNRMAARLKAHMGDILDLKNFHEDILRNVTSGIITVDRRGEVTSINPSARKILYGISPSTALHPGPDPHERDSSDGGPIFDQLRRTLSTGAKVEHRELTLQWPDRDPRVIEVNTSLLASQVGKVFGAIADVRDITQRKRIEAGLIRVEKLASLGELSAGMAHEIRNPLAGIKTSVQVLANKVRNPSEEVLLDGIVHEIDRLDKIVSDLLRFSRPGAPVPTLTDLYDIVENTLTLVAEKVRKQGIRIERAYSGPRPRVLVDRGQIRQVFLNLLLNSIKAMAAGGRLIIEIREVSHANGSQAPRSGRLPGYVEVIFSDTGPGIPEAHLQKIFNPFFTTDPQGTGLGLSIVHKLLEENHGYIFVDSREGAGARVTVGLPAGPIDRQPVPEE